MINNVPTFSEWRADLFLFLFQALQPYSKRFSGKKFGKIMLLKHWPIQVLPASGVHDSSELRKLLSSAQV